MKAAGIIGSIKNFSPLSKGLYNHNVETMLFDTVEHALEWDCDFIIQTNIYNQFKKDKELYQKIKKANKPILVVESPVFRFINDEYYKWYRISWNSFLFPEAVYPWNDTDSSRWDWMKNEYNLEIKPWNTTGEFITIALQKFNDSSLNSLYSDNDEKPFPTYLRWLTSIVKSLNNLGYKKIVLRPHPENNQTQIQKIINAFPKCTVTRDDSYWLNSKRVITYNSLFAIDSIYNGIPVISLSDTSLHNQFGSFNLLDINDDKLLIDRESMFNKLSYCQWREDEVRYGIPFTKLLELMPK